MKKTISILVPTYNEEENVEPLAQAVIDVFEKEPNENAELVNHPKVSATPHIGGSTIEAQKRIGEEIVAIINEFWGENLDGDDKAV